MQTAQFEHWLQNVAGLSVGTVGSRLSNCKRLEHYEGDLDEHFDSDGMAYLLARLVYTATDEYRDAPTLHCVPIHGNRRTGTATLKSAAVLYKRFRENLVAPFESSTRATSRPRHAFPRYALHGKWEGASEAEKRMQAFESWLRDHTALSLGAIGSHVANCKRLERYEGDLDAHFDRDRMATLLARLSYGTADERRGVWPRHRVPISGNHRNGTATLKSSATLYRHYLETVGRAGEPEAEERMQAFENWLLDHTELSHDAIESHVANCKKLERYEGDLDAHFGRDRMATLLARLSYRTADEHRGVRPQHRVPISGNLRNGTANLKSSATLYRHYLETLEQSGEPVEPNRSAGVNWWLAQGLVHRFFNGEER